MGTGTPDDDPTRRLWETIRGQLDRENELLIHRTTWVVGTQAFLFTGYAIALNAEGTGSPSPSAMQERVLAGVLPWAAVASLVLLYLTIAAGLAAIVRLRSHLPDIPDGRLRMLEARWGTRLVGLAGPVLIPAVFLATWLVLLIRQR
jgi:hypothetical protein